MTHRIARRASHPEQRGLRAIEIADRGDIDIAVMVDLAGNHHHVALPVIDKVENRPVWQPSLNNGGRRADGPRALTQQRLPVGEQQVWLERRPGQPGPNGRDQADRAGQYLAAAGSLIMLLRRTFWRLWLPDIRLRPDRGSARGTSPRHSDPLRRRRTHA